MIDLISLISSSPITVNALQKASGHSSTALTLALVELRGRVSVQDGGIVLTAETLKTPDRKKSGPRGPIARSLPRLHAARAALLSLAAIGTTDAKAVLDMVGEGARYTDVLLVAREECAKGALVEGRRGRKAVWSASETVADEALADDDGITATEVLAAAYALFNVDEVDIAHDATDFEGAVDAGTFEDHTEDAF